MKKENGKLKNRIFTACSTFALVAALASCSQLQNNLSSEMNAELLSETGSPSLSGKTWYYNGCSTENLTSSTGYLKINYGQKIRESSKGISGNFLISYTSSSGVLMTATESLSGGFVSEDGKSYCLDMSPVIKKLDYAKTTSSNTGKTTVTQTFKDGIASVTVTLSGLVCDAGDQKGRTISTFNKKISIMPLYTKATLETNFCNTTGAIAGTRFYIPVEGEVTIDTSSAKLVVSGTNVPKDVNFSLNGVSNDGKKIYFVADQDLSGKMFNAKISVYGIAPKTSGVTYSKSFTTIFASGTMTDNIRNDDSSKNSAPLRDVLVYNDSTNLYVRIDFADDAKLWHHSSINILLDNASVSQGKEITLATRKASNTIDANDTEASGIVTGKVNLAEGSSVEMQVCTVITGSDGSGGASGTKTTPTGAADDTTDVFPIAQYAVMPTSVTYKVPLADIGGLKKGDKVYAFVGISSRDNGSSSSPSSGVVGLMNWATSESVTKKESSLDWNVGVIYDTVTIDMTKAVAHTITE